MPQTKEITVVFREHGNHVLIEPRTTVDDVWELLNVPLCMWLTKHNGSQPLLGGERVFSYVVNGERLEVCACI